MAAPPLDLSPHLSRDTALRRISEHLASAGVDEPRREARLLLMAALDLTPALLIVDDITPIGERSKRLAEFVQRRARREPFARILGRKEFYGLEFLLNAETLVPRPDTETLVDAILEHARRRGQDRRPARLIDIGTGTGAILIALLASLPQMTGFGTDLSAKALEGARANADRLLKPGRAAFLCGSWFAGCEEQFDIIASNPPYIPSVVIADLEPEVAHGDPSLALDGGSDGLAAYRALAEAIPPRLSTGGFAAVEIGIDQERQVVDIFMDAGLAFIEARVDLGGVVRVLVFELPS